MRIDILTLFPEMFSALEHSIIKRATDKGAVQINLVNFRDYSTDKHRKVDDNSYSPGAGMVIMAQPVVDCVEATDPNHEAHRIFMTPAAPVLTQKRVRELSTKDWLIILCGHYEGIDQRAIDLAFDEVLSIGEYVLTGGEIPAMTLVDAVARHVPGVINPESLKSESFSVMQNSQCIMQREKEKHNNNSAFSIQNSEFKNANGIFWEHPQYTRPREFRGLSVPEVLFSGNHAEIEKWKRKASEEITRKTRGKK